MINKKLENVTVEDLRLLIENEVIENKTLEYKFALPDTKEADKKEFLADISSLANTEGGDLIFGIKAIDGIPKEIGIEIKNVDSELARLENIIREGITPRINVNIKPVNTDDNKKIIICRVKAGLDFPHRVIYGGSDKFYKRNSNGKYSMDIGELRNAFINSGDLVEKIRRFRDLRIADLKAGESHYPISNNSRFIAIHILPLSAFNSSLKIDSNTICAIKENKISFKPMFTSGWNSKIDFDGLVFYSPDYSDKTRVTNYTQLYRDGKIEVIEDSILVHEGTFLPMAFLEKEILEHLKEVVRFLTELEFQPPFFIFLSLIGVKGYSVSTPRYSVREPEEIIQNDLLLPEIIIDDLSERMEDKIRSIFDMVWYASGIGRSPNFDKDNNFISK